jgi:hypothetical protein
MPYVDGYAKVRVWVPGPFDPPGAPDQGLPGEPPSIGGGPIIPERPGWPERPGQGLPWPGRPVDPGWGVDELPPGIGGGPIIPGRPGQPLPRPPRPVYPVVDDPDGLGGHPALPDLNMTRRVVVTDGSDQFTAYVLDPDPPQVEEGYEPRLPPETWRPGTWVAVLYGSALAWAWVRSITAPEHPEREPKF